MPRGPKGERRPADVIGAAIKVARIATGEEEDAPPPTGGLVAESLGRDTFAESPSAYFGPGVSSFIVES